MINYTEYTDTYTYFSGNIIFKPVGMAGLYRLTQSFINSLLPPDFLKEGTLEWNENSSFPLTVKDGYQNILKDYWKVTLLVVFILVLMILVPLSGLIVWCCRCCGNCGGKARPSNKRRDLSAKIILAILLFIFCGILLLGMVGSFGSNQQLRSGVNDFPDNGRKIFSDFLSYLNSTRDQAENLLQSNYGEFADTFNETLQESGKNILQQLSAWGNDSAINSIFSFVETLPSLVTSLEALNETIFILKTAESELETGLENIKLELNTTLQNCPAELSHECNDVNNIVSNLAIDVNFNNLPDVSSVIILINGTINAAESGKDRLENLESLINNNLSPIIQETNEQIANAGKEIDKNFVTLDNTIGNLNPEFNSLNTTIEDAYGYLHDYFPYFYYVGLSMSCILLLVTVCLFLGLLLGVFGNRPEKYANNCCTKESGSLCLMSGVVILFIFAIVFGLVMCVMFAIGVGTDKIFCYSLRNPNTSTFLDLVDEQIHTTDVEFQSSEALSRCYNNESIYQVLSLENKFNLSDLSIQFNITDSMQRIEEKIKNEWKTYVPEGFQILDNASIEILKQLAQEQPDFKIDIFQSELDRISNTSDLQSIITSLESLTKVANAEFKADINQAIDSITTYNDDILQPTIVNARKALELAIEINRELKMNSTSFADAIEQFIEDVEYVQNELKNSTGLEEVTKYVEVLGNLVKGYVDRVIKVLTEELGQCGPLNVAIHSFIVAVCDEITIPWNGFWVSLFISSISFIPIIILSIWLASLYKSYKPSVQEHERRRSRNNKHIKTQNNFYPANLGHTYDENTSPIGTLVHEYNGNGFSKNKKRDFYQGASAPKVLEYHDDRYNGINQRLRYPEQSTRF